MKVFVVLKNEWVIDVDDVIDRDLESEKITEVYAVYHDYETALKSARGLSLHNCMWGEVVEKEVH